MGSEILLFAITFVFVFPLVYKVLRSSQDPEWEARWNQLPQLQREQIEASVRRGEPLQDREEAELGAGFARQQRSTSALVSHRRVIHFVFAGVLLLIALAGGSPLLAVSILILLAFLIWAAYRERLTKRNLGRAEDAASRP